MNELECRLKDLIIKKYGNLTKFSLETKLPYSTLDSILKRGIGNSNISNVFKITKKLGISAEKLLDGKIEFTNELSSDFKFTVEEQCLIEKIRKLDVHSKELVNTIVDKEYERTI